MTNLFAGIRNYTFFFSLIVFLGSCIDAVNLDPAEPDDLLVVDGIITTEPGPHEVQISRLTRFASVGNGGQIFPEDEAVVFITDDLGNRTDLQRLELIRKEVSNVCPPATECCNPTAFFFPFTSFGYFTPEDFRAEVGRTYILNINTRNGRRYASTPQTVLPSPPIDSLSLRFVRLPSTDEINFDTGIEIFATWQDPPEENFYSWRINGTYQLETPGTPSDRCCLFDPSDSGATLCWINEEDISGNEIAFSDAQINGQRLTRKVGFIQDDGLRFSNVSVSQNRQYYVEVQQMVTSAEVFAFNQLFATQLEIDGDIFDPPPARIGGNISNINNEDEEIIGFFGALAIEKSNIFIDRRDLEFIQRSPGICGDCRVRGGATTEIPEPFR